MKKILKYIVVGLLAIVLFFIGFYLIKNEKLPEGTPSLAADKMAMEMLHALNIDAWDTTIIVSWTFRGDHKYVWNREQHFVTATWDDYEVGYQTDDGFIFISDDEQYTSEEIKKIQARAIANFNNDSFWLCAPYKVFDPGTERSIVQTKDGRTGLMITYTSGGSTPGDSYVWMLDENYLPTSVKMWVSILPIGGIEFTWENYQTLSSGAMIAKDHTALGFLNIPLGDIK